MYKFYLKKKIKMLKKTAILFLISYKTRTNRLAEISNLIHDAITNDFSAKPNLTTPIGV